MAKVWLEIDGYVNPMPSNLGYDVSEDEIRDIKVDFYEALNEDFRRRLVDIEEINTSDWDAEIEDYDEYDEEAFTAYIAKRADELIAERAVKIDRVDFQPYYEHGTYNGYDYETYLQIDLNALYKEWKAEQTGDNN